ncbi:MAG TPA: DUF4301 family protein [Desulfuromonadales bacterium]|nr:DUF4301 family protein [Desulfuromonadales bacterium]
MEFTAEDISQLAAQGLPEEKARRQLEMLQAGQARTRLERACTPGDGILQPTGSSDLLKKRFEGAVADGRLCRFVPASGAASRMFKALYAEPEIFEACRSEQVSAEATASEKQLRKFFDNLTQFAFYHDLAEAMAEDGYKISEAIAKRDLQKIVRYLLEPCGLNYAELPKGLLAFHQTADGTRTPFIEHQAEAAMLCGSEQSISLHFTVTDSHKPLFAAQRTAWAATLQETYGAELEVSYSLQKPSTDTLSLGADGEPLRDAQGRLILRPGGHGALVENLNDLQGDILLIRNIDNVVPDDRKGGNLANTCLLIGLLLELQDEQHGLLRSLASEGDTAEIRDLCLSFLCDRLQLEIPVDADRTSLMNLLNRPLRVCGMVPNSGEPGGGPFWVRDSQGRLSRQIVEGAQIDKDDPEQMAILQQSTHFNPVDMVCAVRDWQGRPYDLPRFVDNDAVIVTEKSQEGQTIRALELPGLWNGGMAHWHTLFVEIPEETFNPVKTVFDLLRPAHQA